MTNLFAVTVLDDSKLKRNPIQNSILHKNRPSKKCFLTFFTSPTLRRGDFQKFLKIIKPYSDSFVCYPN